MNNKYITTLLCAMVLALTPACSKKQSSYVKTSADKQKTSQEDVNTMIELDNTIFEIEETDTNNEHQANAKS